MSRKRTHSSLPAPQTNSLTTPSTRPWPQLGLIFVTWKHNGHRQVHYEEIVPQRAEIDSAPERRGRYLGRADPPRRRPGIFMWARFQSCERNYHHLTSTFCIAPFEKSLMPASSNRLQARTTPLVSQQSSPEQLRHTPRVFDALFNKHGSRSDLPMTRLGSN